jgi:hypothetical protein
MMVSAVASETRQRLATHRTRKSGTDMERLAAQSNKSGNWSCLRECGRDFIVRLPLKRVFGDNLGAVSNTAPRFFFWDAITPDQEATQGNDAAHRARSAFVSRTFRALRLPSVMA